MHEKHSANMHEWMHAFLAVERYTDGYILLINNREISFSQGPAKSCANRLLERQQQDYIIRIDVSDFEHRFHFKFWQPVNSVNKAIGWSLSAWNKRKVKKDKILRWVFS